MKKHGYLWTVAHQRCPECGRGIVYRRPMEMNNLCPACGAKFEREPGYFTGAIYIGILLMLPLAITFIWLILLLFPDVHPAVGAMLGMFGVIPLTPLTIRVSRIMWMYIGRSFAPNDPRSNPPGSYQPQIDPVPPRDTGERRLPRHPAPIRRRRV